MGFANLTVDELSKMVLKHSEGLAIDDNTLKIGCASMFFSLQGGTSLNLNPSDQSVTTASLSSILTKNNTIGRS